jgi:CRP-like cAMP-binding protein
MNSNSGKSDDGASCEYQENLNILRQIDFFSGLSLDATKVMAYLCSRERFKPGDFLFQQDEEEGRAFYIISGSARLSHRSETEDLHIRDYGEGEFIGRLSLTGNMRRLFNLQAETDVLCLTISQEKFNKALQQFPDQLPKMIRVIVDNIYRWEKRFLKERTGDCSDCMRKIGVSLV